MTMMDCLLIVDETVWRAPLFGHKRSQHPAANNRATHADEANDEQRARGGGAEREASKPTQQTATPTNANNTTTLCKSSVAPAPGVAKETCENTSTCSNYSGMIAAASRAQPPYTLPPLPSPFFPKVAHRLLGGAT